MSIELGRGLLDRLRQTAEQRAAAASNALRDAEMAVLTGPRSGRIYGGHQASAPGEAPAEDTGHLRGVTDGGWRPITQVEQHGDELILRSAIVPNAGEAPYVAFFDPDLPGSTPFLDPRRQRPFVQRIRDAALPAIRRLYREPWLR